MTEDELRQFIREVEDPTCDHAGPYAKDGSCEPEIVYLLGQHGYVLTLDGYAVPDEAPGEDAFTQVFN